MKKKKDFVFSETGLLIQFFDNHERQSFGCLIYLKKKNINLKT